MPRRRRVALVIDLQHQLRHHYGIFSGARRYASERGWECLSLPFFTGKASRRQSAAPLDGIIARATLEVIRIADRLGVPLVNVWSTTASAAVPTVIHDSRTIARLAGEHLWQLGFRRFAFHGFSRHRASRDSFTGFTDVLRTSKANITRLTVPTTCDETSGAWTRYTGLLEQWIARWQPPVGVFAVQDVLARYLANACLAAGLRIPEDVGIVGAGNEPLICRYPEPSLSSVEGSEEQVGYEAAALLDRLMDGKPAPAAPVLVPPGHLIARRSTAASQVNDPLVAAALRYINAHCHDELRSEDIARHVHATVRTLERHFRAAMGRTMSAEINRLRIERAKRLLLESDALVKAIARQCGFNDVKHFHRQFQAATGVTPGQFRQRR